MKRLTWRFRKSPFIDRDVGHFIRHELPYMLGLTAILVIASCQLSHRVDRDESLGDGPQAPLALQPPLAPPTPPATLAAGRQVVLRNAAGVMIGEVAVGSCGSPPTTAELTLKTLFTSDFGEQPVRFTVRGDGPSETVRVEVEGYRLGFAATRPVKTKMVQRICAALATADASGESPTVVAEPADVDALHEWMELMAPDCDATVLTAAGAAQTNTSGAEVSTPKSAWRCRLPMIDPEAARLELTVIQTTMIRRWSRQPYLLARRLAVGVTLAQAIEARNPDKSLNTFCNVVANSMPVELPATLASKRWQDAVCGKDRSHRLDAAKFGLAKTVAEVDFMRQLFERTSRLGYLALHIPASQIPSREVLVNLEPGADVADNLTHEAAHLLLTESGETTPEDIPRACWHPVYGEDASLLKLARQLAMAGEAARIVCEDTQSMQARTFLPERYVAESVTSESQFIMTNGRAKTLRLPIGKYNYTLRSLPENQEDWDDASQSGPRATGEITWDAKRPRPVISAW